MPVRRLLPGFLVALFAAFLLSTSTARAEDPKPDPGLKPALVKDVTKAKDDATKSADISWMLVSSALVMLMMPGLALFYGGMARRKNVLGTMMHTMIALGLVGVQWVTFGYSLAFGDPIESLKISISETDVEKKTAKGDTEIGADGKPVMVKAPIKASLLGYSKKLLCLQESAAIAVKPEDELKAKSIDPEKATQAQKDEAQKEADAKNKYNTFPNTKLPLYLHAMFQGMFAIITVALISGAFAERVKFFSYLLFALVWTTVVYDPIAHWVWSVEWVKPDGAKPEEPFASAGIFGANGAIDFAGGTVVHIAAGFSGLAAILLLRKRIGYGKQTFHPNSMVLTLLGAGLLWFGWFGFNGGSALAANTQAVSAFTVTQIAAAMAGITWTVIEWIHRGKPTGLGFASGLVAGLVAITPASGFVAPGGALAIGMAAGVGCYLFVALKSLLGYDDSLDAFGIHGVGGFLGAVLTGVFVSLPLWAYGTDLDVKLFPGKLNDAKTAIDYSSQIMWQIKTCAASAIYAFVVTGVLVLLIDWTIGFTVKPADEATGLDLSQHGEVGFDVGQIEEETYGPEPKAAVAPPVQTGGKTQRFTVIIDGADPKKLHAIWAELCKPPEGDAKTSKEFTEVYKYLTTISGNKFRFRGGDPIDLKKYLGKLFEETLDQSGIHTHVEH